MAEAAVSKPKSEKLASSVNWNPWLGVLMVLAIYILSQVVGLTVLIYPFLHHWSGSRSSNW
ncbi:MAG TPA: hypothetical protein VGF75_07925, partial [Candidatus Saccharimonadales bacterium]